MHFACGRGWQIVFCGVGINQDLPSPVGKMKAIAVHVDAVADPLVAAVVLRLPFVDLDFVEAARRVAHRTGKHLGAFSLAANVNEAHRYAADRNARSIFENFVLPHHSEPFEKGPECRHESYRQETGWIGVSAHMPLRSGTCYFKRDERCNQVSHPCDVSCKGGVCEQDSVFAGFFRSQITGTANLIDAQTARGELGNLATALGWKFDLKYLSADKTSSGAFVHGEEVSALPVPAVIGMVVVDAYHHFQLRLAPETRAIRWRKANAGIEIGQFEFAVLAKQIDSGRVVGIFAKVIVSYKFEAGFLGSGHLVFRLKHHPLAASTDPILFILVGAHGAALSNGPGCAEQRHARQSDLDSHDGAARFTR